jgi:hypothetical protein
LICNGYIFSEDALSGSAWKSVLLIYLYIGVQFCSVVYCLFQAMPARHAHNAHSARPAATFAPHRPLRTATQPRAARAQRLKD